MPGQRETSASPPAEIVIGRFPRARQSL